MVVLPSRSNKYHRIGAVRLRLLARRLEPQLDEDTLDTMHLDTLQGLIRYALALGPSCAAPSKIWGEIKTQAMIRYKEIGEGRLSRVVLMKRGDSKIVYYEPDYSIGGCFERQYKGIGAKSKLTGLKHASGVIAPVKPALDASYWIDMNDNDNEAVLKSSTAIGEIPVRKIFDLAGLLDKLPAALGDERVGMPSAKTNKSRSTRLALMDKEQAATPDPAAAAPTTTTLAIPTSQNAAAKKKNVGSPPSGSGAPKPRVGPPSKRGRNV